VKVQEYYHKTKDINIDFWKMADESFKAIFESGMIVMSEPIWTDAESWVNYEEWKELADYMTARYCAYPMHYGMAPEYDNTDKQRSGFDEMTLSILKYLRDIDPYKRAFSIQPSPWNLGVSKKDWKAPYVDYIMLEGAHEDPWGISTDFYKEAWELNRPLALTETVWEDLQRHQFPPHSSYAVRYNMYRAFLSGCVATSYGANGLWYPRSADNDDVFDRDWGKSVTWDEALNLEGANNAMYLKKFFSKIEWWNIQPLFNCGLSSKDILPPYPVMETAEIMPQITSTNTIIEFPENKDDYTMPIAARFNNKIVIYIPKCKSNINDIYINVSCAFYKCLWYNVRTGKYICDDKIVKSDGKMKLPNRPDNEDWILLLEESVTI